MHSNIDCVSDSNDQSDIIWGAEQISDLLGLTKRQVYYLAERGDLPVGKLRTRLFARRSTLLQFLDRLSTGRVGAET